MASEAVGGTPMTVYVDQHRKVEGGSATPVYITNLAGAGPDPTGATDGFVWTADGVGGAGWEGVPGAVTPDVDDLTTTTGVANDMLRVGAGGGLEYRTPAEVLSDIGAAGTASLANYLPLAGGTMSGNIAMSGAQTVDGVDVSALGSTVSGHVGSTSNPHSVTAAQAGALPLDGAILSKSGAYQLAAGDEGKIIECDGTFTITAPDGLDAGFQVALVNVGTGIITVAASTTLQAKGAAYTLANQYGMATLYHRGANVWLLAGDLT